MASFLIFVLYLTTILWTVQSEFKKTNIVFLKTHKCASSAVQNIFLRFGYVHDLLFVLPPKHNYLCQYKPFNKSMVPKLMNGHYNVLTHHSRFNYREMKQLMPKDTVFVTILRDPVRHFESLFGYYNLKSYYGMEINDLNSYPIESWEFKFKPWERAYGKFGFNQMLYDLGFDAMNKTVDQVDDYIDILEKQFDLVMIADLMNESLIFLKLLLNWDYSDITVFEVNAREHRSILDQEVAEIIRTLNWADTRLYRRFHDKLQEMVSNFGIDRMRNETYHLKKTINEWMDRCDAPENDEERDSCDLLKKKELDFTELLRKRQMSIALY